MKKTKKLYWIWTSVFAAFTTLTAISQLVPFQSSVTVMEVLKFPLYMLPFLGLAKLLGVVAIFVHRSPRVTEWAYAGIMIDFIGATYSMIAVGGKIDKWGFMILPILTCTLSYFYYYKLSQLKKQPA